MADRKKQVEQAIAESVEMSKAPKPAKPAAKTPTEKLKSFSLNQSEKAAAAAPLHPRATKGQSVRTRELQAGMSAGRDVRSRAEEQGKAKVASGEGIIGHKKVTRQGVEKIVAQPATPPLNAEQIAPPAATKKPKPSTPKRMKKASTPQLRFKGE
jgi:hypothetical protein